MRKVFILLINVAWMGAIHAQQRPHYTQYILNNYILNPAISGIENYTDVKISIRNQWVGIEGAPRTFYITAHTPIGKKDYRTSATSFAVPGQNPRGKSYWESYTAPEPHHGVGMNLINYKTGYISRVYALATYAYHIGLGPQTSLAGGFGGGISYISIDKSKIELANPVDPAIGSLTGELSKIRPELTAGLWLYSSDYFVGLSAQQIIPQKIKLVEDDYYRSTLVPHLFLTAGYRVALTEDITALPSSMLRYISSMPLFVDFNLKIQYQDKCWLGGSVRLKEGFAAMAGLNVSNTFNVSYAYDVNNSNYLIQSMQRGTHEIVAGFIIGNKYGDSCPRNLW